MKDFIVVPAGRSLVAKKVNFAKGALLQMTKTKGLVPTVGKDVNRNLSADRVFELVVGKGGLEGTHQASANLMLVVIGLKVETFLVRAVAANRTDVDHGIAKLDKAAALHGNVQIGNVVEDEVDELLVARLAEKPNEALFRGGREWLLVS